MLVAREGRFLVRRGQDMPDNITSNCEYVAVNLSEVVSELKQRLGLRRV